MDATQSAKENKKKKSPGGSYFGQTQVGAQIQSEQNAVRRSSRRSCALINASLARCAANEAHVALDFSLRYTMMHMSTARQEPTSASGALMSSDDASARRVLRRRKASTTQSMSHPYAPCDLTDVTTFVSIAEDGTLLTLDLTAAAAKCVEVNEEFAKMRIEDTMKQYQEMVRAVEAQADEKEKRRLQEHLDRVSAGMLATMVQWTKSVGVSLRTATTSYEGAKEAAIIGAKAAIIGTKWVGKQLVFVCSNFVKVANYLQPGFLGPGLGGALLIASAAMKCGISLYTAYNAGELTDARGRFNVGAALREVGAVGLELSLSMLPGMLLAGKVGGVGEAVMQFTGAHHIASVFFTPAINAVVSMWRASVAMTAEERHQARLANQRAEMLAAEAAAGRARETLARALKIAVLRRTRHLSYADAAFELDCKRPGFLTRHVRAALKLAARGDAMTPRDLKLVIGAMLACGVVGHLPAVSATVSGRVTGMVGFGGKIAGYVSGATQFGVTFGAHTGIAQNYVVAKARGAFATLVSSARLQRGLSSVASAVVRAPLYIVGAKERFGTKRAAQLEQYGNAFVLAGLNALTMHAASTATGVNGFLSEGMRSFATAALVGEPGTMHAVAMQELNCVMHEVPGLKEASDTLRAQFARVVQGSPMTPSLMATLKVEAQDDAMRAYAWRHGVGEAGKEVLGVSDAFEGAMSNAALGSVQLLKMRADGTTELAYLTGRNAEAIDMKLTEIHDRMTHEIGELETALSVAQGSTEAASVRNGGATSTVADLETTITKLRTSLGAFDATTTTSGFGSVEQLLDELAATVQSFNKLVEFGSELVQRTMSERDAKVTVIILEDATDIRETVARTMHADIENGLTLVRMRANDEFKARMQLYGEMNAEQQAAAITEAAGAMQNTLDAAKTVIVNAAVDRAAEQAMLQQDNITNLGTLTSDSAREDAMNAFVKATVSFLWKERERYMTPVAAGGGNPAQDVQPSVAPDVTFVPPFVQLDMHGTRELADALEFVRQNDAVVLGTVAGSEAAHTDALRNEFDTAAAVLRESLRGNDATDAHEAALDGFRTSRDALFENIVLRSAISRHTNEDLRASSASNEEWRANLTGLETGSLQSINDAQLTAYTEGYNSVTSGVHVSTEVDLTALLQRANIEGEKRANAARTRTSFAVQRNFGEMVSSFSADPRAQQAITAALNRLMRHGMRRTTEADLRGYSGSGLRQIRTTAEDEAQSWRDNVMQLKVDATTIPSADAELYSTTGAHVAGIDRVVDVILNPTTSVTQRVALGVVLNEQLHTLQGVLTKMRELLRAQEEHAAVTNAVNSIRANAATARLQLDAKAVADGSAAYQEAYIEYVRAHNAGVASGDITTVDEVGVRAAAHDNGIAHATIMQHTVLDIGIRAIGVELANEVFAVTGPHSDAAQAAAHAAVAAFMAMMRRDSSDGGMMGPYIPKYAPPDVVVAHPPLTAPNAVPIVTQPDIAPTTGTGSPSLKPATTETPLAVKIDVPPGVSDEANFELTRRQLINELDAFKSGKHMTILESIRTSGAGNLQRTIMEIQAEKSPAEFALAMRLMNSKLNLGLSGEDIALLQKNALSLIQASPANNIAEKIITAMKRNKDTSNIGRCLDTHNSKSADCQSFSLLGGAVKAAKVAHFVSGVTSIAEIVRNADTVVNVLDSATRSGALFGGGHAELVQATVGDAVHGIGKQFLPDAVASVFGQLKTPSLETNWAENFLVLALLQPHALSTTFMAAVNGVTAAYDGTWYGMISGGVSAVGTVALGTAQLVSGVVPGAQEAAAEIAKFTMNEQSIDVDAMERLSKLDTSEGREAAKMLPFLSKGVTALQEIDLSRVQTRSEFISAVTDADRRDTLATELYDSITAGFGWSRSALGRRTMERMALGNDITQFLNPEPDFLTMFSESPTDALIALAAKSL